MNTEMAEREGFEEKKSLAINDIIENGLITPGERLLGVIGKEKLCSPGVLFFGIGDCVFLSILVSAMCWMLFLNIDTKYLCSGIFGMSPLVYILSYIFTSWKENQLNLYEMKMVCRCDLRRVIAYRMLCFGLINMVTDLCFIGVLQAGGAGVLLWRYLAISFLGIFLFGICALMVRMRENLWCDMALAPAIWIVFNAAIFLCLRDKIEYFLYHIEAYILTGLAAWLCICHIAMLLFYPERKRGGKTDAFGE